MKTAKVVTDAAVRAMDEYNKECIHVLSLYREGMKDAEAQAHKYKNEEEYLADRRRQLGGIALNELRMSANVVQAELKAARNELRGIVNGYIGKAPSADFIDTLKVYRDFGLRMSEGELNALLAKAVGNHIELRALAEVAKDSKFYFFVPDADSYCRILKELDSWVDREFRVAPHDFAGEAAAVFNSQHTDILNDGRRVDSRHVVIAASGWDGLKKDLTAVGVEWTRDFVPKIQAYMDGETASVEDVISAVADRQNDVAAAVDAIDVGVGPGRSR